MKRVDVHQALAPQGKQSQLAAFRLNVQELRSVVLKPKLEAYAHDNDGEALYRGWLDFYATCGDATVSFVALDPALAEPGEQDAFAQFNSLPVACTVIATVSLSDEGQVSTGTRPVPAGRSLACAVPWNPLEDGSLEVECFRLSDVASALAFHLGARLSMEPPIVSPAGT